MAIRIGAADMYPTLFHRPRPRARFSETAVPAGVWPCSPRHAPKCVVPARLRDTKAVAPQSMSLRGLVTSRRGSRTGVLVDLAEQPRPDVLGRERRAHGGPRELGDAGRVEVQQPGGDLVLAVQRGAEHRRVVG